MLATLAVYGLIYFVFLCCVLALIEHTTDKLKGGKK